MTTASIPGAGTLALSLKIRSLARSLARITIEDYYADRKVTLRVLYY
eukprot:COSAG05_NODE_22160_length_266_cov_1.874251_1_plen_46_part_10